LVAQVRRQDGSHRLTLHEAVSETSEIAQVFSFSSEIHQKTVSRSYSQLSRRRERESVWENFVVGRCWQTKRWSMMSFIGRVSRWSLQRFCASRVDCLTVPQI